MISLRAKAQHSRYRSAVAVLLVVLGLLVVWEHTATEEGHAEHGHAGEVVSMCMAVLAGAVAVLGFVALAKRASWPTLVQIPRPANLRPRRRPWPRSRAGPTELQVLLR